MTRSRLAKRKAGVSRRGGLFWALVLIILILVTTKIVFSGSIWDGKTRLAVAVDNGDKTSLIVFDPGSESVVQIDIPGNTLVEAGGDLGSWKLGSIWELGENEGIGGALLSQTVTKSFNLPTEAYASRELLGITSKNPFALISGVVGVYRTNLSLKDKIRTAVFSLDVKSSGRIKIDLSESGALEKGKLPDGEVGYKIVREVPQSISSYFADSAVSDEGLAIVIADATKTPGISSHLGVIIESLGAKVVSIEKDIDTKADVDCNAFGPKSLTLTKLANIFGCKTFVEKGDFIKIEIGEKFAKRF